MRWFYNMKIASKLILGFLIMAIIAGVVGIVGLAGILDSQRVFLVQQRIGFIHTEERRFNRAGRRHRAD